MKKKWITLFPGTFIWTKKNEGVVYNTNKSQIFHFELNNKIEKICKQLLFPDNLYTAVLTIEDLENDELKKWIHSVTKIYEAGYLTSGTEEKPVSYLPILKMLNDADYYAWEDQQGFGGNIMLNLHELTFYLNKTDSGNDTWFRQTKFPFKNCAQLNIESVISFVQHSQNPYLSNINFAGNIFSYPNYQKLIDQMENLGVVYTIQISIQDFADHITDLRKKKWTEQVRFNVLIDSSYSTSPWILFNDIDASISVTAFVNSENEYNLFNDQFKNMPIYCDAQVIPIYNGNNLSFFENNVFIEQDDIDEMTLTKREIFMHKVLNTNDFGKLTILPNGNVYANVNMEPLGTIKDTVYSIVHKEFTEGKSWLRIRDMEPCCNCVYQWLCPSPSNYELAFGKPNLCHVKP